jgi:hypothetical protein
MISFPRLLVATEFPPNASGGGPAVVRQMLKDWPVHKLFWWSILQGPTNQDQQKVAAHRVASIPPRLYPHRRATKAKSWLVENCWVPYAAHNLQKTMAAIRPEVVWVIPHLWAIPPLARVLPHSRVGFHATMQDYINARSHVIRFGRSRSNRFARLADDLYSQATTRDATSRAMVADLAARTGRNAAQVLHAGLEETDFAYLATKRAFPMTEIRIAHPGTITVEADIELLIAALGRVRESLSRPLTLEFFGSLSYRQRPWFEPQWMVEHGSVPTAELAQQLKQFTWGLATMGGLDDDPQYSRFSFPTKFITCLAAGLSMITYGHLQSSLARIACAYRVGVHLNSTALPQLEQELFSALLTDDPWSEFGSEIQRCARTEFDASQMRKTLYECFVACSGHSDG